MFGPRDFPPHGSMALSKRLKRGLLLLLSGHDYAVDVQRDPWDFATEIHAARRAGLTNNDFCWLVARGLVVHAAEITPPGSMKRQFQPQNKLAFTAKTCFVLTEQGVIAAKRLRKRAARTIVAKLVASGAGLN